jgi:hypothetical protein
MVVGGDLHLGPVVGAEEKEPVGPAVGAFEEVGQGGEVAEGLGHLLPGSS